MRSIPPQERSVSNGKSRGLEYLNEPDIKYGGLSQCTRVPMASNTILILFSDRPAAKITEISLRGSGILDWRESQDVCKRVPRPSHYCIDTFASL